MEARLERGMYILLRQGSACHNLRPLLKGVTPENSRRCLLCSDDRQPKTILKRRTSGQSLEDLCGRRAGRSDSNPDGNIECGGMLPAS